MTNKYTKSKAIVDIHIQVALIIITIFSYFTSYYCILVTLVFRNSPYLSSCFTTYIYPIPCSLVKKFLWSQPCLLNTYLTSHFMEPSMKVVGTNIMTAWALCLPFIFFSCGLAVVVSVVYLTTVYNACPKGAWEQWGVHPITSNLEAQCDPVVTDFSKIITEGMP